MDKYKKDFMIEKIIDLLLILFVIPVIVISAIILPFGTVLYFLFKLKVKKYSDEGYGKL